MQIQGETGRTKHNKAAEKPEKKSKALRRAKTGVVGRREKNGVGTSD